jgi:hypothetical protein
LPLWRPGGPSYRAAIDNAHAVGAEDEEILETVLAIIPLIGTASLAKALPNLITALEHDIWVDGDESNGRAV